MNPETSKPAEEEGSGAPAGSNGVSPEDWAFIQRCRTGETQAFDALVRKYQHRLFNTVFRMCGRRADAEELTQEALLRALENLHRFRGGSAFYTWLFRIAANLTISRRRRARRVRFFSLSGSDDEDPGREGALTADLACRRTPGPEAEAVAGETSRRVVEALNELDDEFRIVIVLRDIEGMDYVQIADILDTPLGTVKSRLHRARLLLRARLADLVREP